MNIRLGPWKISVDLTSSEDLEGDYGDWDLKTKTVRVREDLEALEMSMTLIHEMIHAMSDLHHLRLSEQSVRALENSITQLIQDHPELASLLTKAIAPNIYATNPQPPSGDTGRFYDPSTVPDGDADEAPDGRAGSYGCSE